jgi:hypothetical protein
MKRDIEDASEADTAKAGRGSEKSGSLFTLPVARDMAKYDTIRDLREWICYTYNKFDDIPLEYQTRKVAIQFYSACDEWRIWDDQLDPFYFADADFRAEIAAANPTLFLKHPGVNPTMSEIRDIVTRNATFYRCIPARFFADRELAFLAIQLNAVNMQYCLLPDFDFAMKLLTEVEVTSLDRIVERIAAVDFALPEKLKIVDIVATRSPKSLTALKKFVDVSVLMPHVIRCAKEHQNYAALVFDFRYTFPPEIIPEILVENPWAFRQLSDAIVHHKMDRKALGKMVLKADPEIYTWMNQKDQDLMRAFSWRIGVLPGSYYYKKHNSEYGIGILCYRALLKIQRDKRYSLPVGVRGSIFAFFTDEEMIGVSLVRMKIQESFVWKRAGRLLEQAHKPGNPRLPIMIQNMGDSMPFF